MQKLFYDGSCPLCRKEIAWLRPKLQNQLELIDISEDIFTGYGDATREQMMQQIHLWTGTHFKIGLDASLSYWHMAGWRFIPWILQRPGIYWLANQAYLYWAKRRVRCSTGSSLKTPKSCKR